MTEIEKVDLERGIFDLERAKKDADFFEKMQEQDLFNSKEEIKRRGIEVCINVLKNSRELKQGTLSKAEDKLLEFIKALQIP